MAEPSTNASDAANASEATAMLMRSAAEVLTPHVKRLLAKMEVLPMNGCRISWPGDGTLLAAWLHCEGRVIRTPTPDEFDRYRLIKSRLRAHDQPPSAATIRMLQRLAGDRPITQHFARMMIGRSCRTADISAAGLPTRGQAVERTRSTPDWSDLLDVLPEPCRERLRAEMDRDVLPPVIPPTVHQVGRALALSGDACRMMAAVALLMVSASRKSKSLGMLCLYIAERIDALVPAELQTCEAAVTEALDRCASDGPTAVITRSLYHYDGKLAQIGMFLDRVLGNDADAVKALLPARHRDHQTFRRTMWRLCFGRMQQSRSAKDLKIAGLFESLEGITIGCDNRVAQLEAIFLAVGSARIEVEDAGSELPRVIECVVPVVRSDGSLGSGRQIVRFELRGEHDLVRVARASAPRDARIVSLDYYRRKSIGAAVAAASRSHLVYLGCRPLSEGGECVEPFFVQLYRVGLFDDGSGLSTDRSQERIRSLDDAGLPLGAVCSRGFLRHDASQLNIVRALRRALGDDAPVIVPMTALMHAMSVAHIVVRMGIRWGMRIGATRQLRMGCLSTEMFNGRLRCVAELRLKGSLVMQRCEIDGDTVERIRRVMKLAHVRWFRDVFDGGRPAVPIVPFRGSPQSHIPPARYILVGPNGPLCPADLGIFIRVLLIGLADVTSHDFRYLFATALGFGGADRREIGAGLHHRPGSSTTARYDVSDEVRRRRSGSNTFDASSTDLGEQQ